MSTNMEVGDNVRAGKISSEDVISKLKDDGDFDKLRLKIIRKLKEDEELRKNIISKVMQASVLDRPGVENMKPRQLSDAIHEEIGEQVMHQISDSVWDIIRTEDKMKSEITQTVLTIYNKLSNPLQNNETESMFCGTGPNEPPGFSLSKLHEDQENEAQCDNSDEDLDVPPGFG